MPFYIYSDPVDDEFLNNIVTDFPNSNFSAICLGLGWRENPAQNELETANKNYAKTYRKALGDWKNRGGGTRQELANILAKAGYKIKV